MRSIFLGLASYLDDGTMPGVAIDTSGRVVEVHKNEGGYRLYARTGQLDGATVAWNDLGEDRDEYTKGTTPACATNGAGTVVEVHKNEEGKKLYSMVGVLSGTGIAWGDSEDFDSAGVEPAVAVNDSHIAVTVYREEGESNLRYRLGSIDRGDKEATYYDRHDFASGSTPRVALNNHNQVVAVWYESLKVHYRVGVLTSSSPSSATISWGDPQELTDGGSSPAVALTDDGFVTLVHLDDVGVELFQWTGFIDATAKVVRWDSERVYYDDGRDPCVAAAGNRVIALHRGDSLANLYFTTSIVTDRANWMRDRLGRLGSRQVRNLVLPASHDSGMYTSGISVLAKTQELSILGQLEYGIRYFDLRPKYDAGDNRIDIQHGGIEGPTLAEVLLDIQTFAAAGRQELIVIDFSHFEDFGSPTNSPGYELFRQQVETALGTWMIESKPENVRLADLTLGELVREGAAILVSVDEAWAVDNPTAGFWVFRNGRAWDDKAEQYPYAVADGDLRVYDAYSDTTDYEDMKADQLQKYSDYDGLCAGTDHHLVCDLFLLSWTLTPWTGVWFDSKDCNRHLGSVMAGQAIPNSFGQVPNLLYVDYCEFARVTDVALFANGTPDAD